MSTTDHRQLAVARTSSAALSPSSLDMIFDFSEDFKGSKAAPAAGLSGAAGNRKRRDYEGRGDRSPLKAIKLNSCEVLPSHKSSSVENYVVSKEKVPIIAIQPQESAPEALADPAPTDKPFSSTEPFSIDAHDGDLSSWISNELVNLGFGCLGPQVLDSVALTIVQKLLKEVNPPLLSPCS